MTPILFSSIRGYSRRLFFADLVAGVTVAMVALPLSMAIAIASGAEPAQGLVTAIVAGFIISLLGGSNYQIGGPTGAFIVVVYGVIADHGYSGLIVATLMAGVILIAAALLRAGKLMRHVPKAVIDGFTIGIAIIIATSQFKDFLGIEIANAPAEFFGLVHALWSARASADFISFGIGISSVLCIVLARKIAPRAPGLIVAVGIISAVVAIWALPVDTIHSRFGDLPHQLPLPQLNLPKSGQLSALIPSAFIIAFLAGIESLLSASVADNMTKTKHRPNAELFAQGSANIASALFGGLPATGAIARTATNIRAGGVTPIAGIVHALVLYAAVLFAAPLAGYLAMPALAGLLMVTAWNMSEPNRWGEYLQLPRADRWLLVLTLVLTVLADLTIAISIGVGIGLALRLHRRGAPPPNWH